MIVFTIIVTYNGSKWIDKCFGSLVSSSFSTKIIAVDNNSTDGTPEIIKERYPQCEIIKNIENIGFGRANNIGIRKAYDDGADYVFLLNQDAWVENDTIEKLVKGAEKNPEFGVISPMHLDGAGEALDFNFSKWTGPDRCPELYSDVFLGKIKDQIYETSFVNAAAWLISRRCVETVGGFNPLFFMYGEDINYLQRVRYYGLKIGIHPILKIFHDRETKKSHGVFILQEKKFILSLLQEHCDPANSTDIGLKIFWLRGSVFKSIIKFNLNRYKKQRKELRIISEIQHEIRSAVEKSRKPGLTFL